MTEPLSNPSVTTGSWSTEEQAEEYFVSFVRMSGLFKVYRQVSGEPLWKHPFQKCQGLRADILLFPGRALLKGGWDGGCIVVEVKRSGEKIGPGLNQLLDYMSAAWLVPAGAVVPGFGFLFPATKQHGPMASLMAHRHFGTAGVWRDRTTLHCGESRVLTFAADGRFDIGKTHFGHKTGAR